MIKKCILIFFLCSYSLFAEGCDFFYKLLDKEGAEEKALVGDFPPFEENHTVVDIQYLLKIYGYNPGNIDGIFGAKTRKAIKKFQQDHGLKESGFADKETWAHLNKFVQNGLITSNKVNIQIVQELLQRAGFSPGKIDGKFGPRTKKAVITFQQHFNLKADGQIGYNTLERLSDFFDKVKQNDLK